MNLYNIFLQILHMSLTASAVILVVLFARLCLKKLPKIYSYALWAVVLFRLLCPVSISSDFSLLGIFAEANISDSGINNSVVYATPEILEKESLENSQTVPETNQGSQTFSDENKQNGNSIVKAQEETKVDFTAIITGIWLFGIAVMLGYSLISYATLRSKLVGAIHLRDNIYVADHIASPFAMGILNPRIYLRSSLEEEQEYIILHEQHHIHRQDHIVKVLAYLALCIHWFNPLVWIAYILAVKDMEMSCDEAVIRKLGEEIRADYSASLLSFSTGQKMLFGTPLAFSEGDAKSRIYNLAKWKKPTTWVNIMAVIACGVIIWGCATNPEKEQIAPEPFGHSYRVEEIVSYSSLSSYRGESGAFYELSSDYQLTHYGKIIGGFKEVALSKENFDDYFDFMMLPEGWSTEEEYAAFLRENNKAAWKLLTEGDEAITDCYYLLLQENGDVYLVQGVCVQEKTDTLEPEDSYMQWINKLARTDLLSCLAVSEGLEAYIKPIYSLGSIDHISSYSNATDGEIRSSGQLIFTADWETDALTVKESYHEKQDGSVQITERTYSLPKTEDGKFVLDVSKRNVGEAEEAFYFIQGETGSYIMKIEFSADGQEEAERKTEASDWGIEFFTKNVTPTGLTMVCKQSGGNQSGELLTGSYYIVEEKVGNEWKPVAYKDTGEYEIAWTAEAWIIPTNAIVEWDVEWEWIHGELPAGQYRIGKEVIDYGETRNYGEAMVYAEFEIK